MSTLRTCALWLVAVSSLLGGFARAADPPAGDLIGRLKAKVKEGQPFQMCVRIHLKPGTEETLAAEAAKAAKATAAEPGCDGYTFYRDLEEPGTVILFEKWKNIAALEAHIKQPYVASLLKLLGDQGAEATMQLLGPFTAQKPAP